MRTSAARLVAEGTGTPSIAGNEGSPCLVMVARQACPVAVGNHQAEVGMGKLAVAGEEKRAPVIAEMRTPGQ